MSTSQGSESTSTDVLAIDIGSSCVKLGYFAGEGSCTSDKPASGLPIAAPQLPEPIESLTIAHKHELSAAALDELENWIGENFPSAPRVLLASVQPNVAERLVSILVDRGWSVPRRLTWEDLRLEVRIDLPQRVGIDRLLNAVAANRLRDPQRPAIVVDLGTAGTVDLIAIDGAFEGGAILPGMSLSAQALHRGTSSLPAVEVAALEDSISAVGKRTDTAIAAGLYWGTVGAINKVVEQISSQCGQTPQLFATGGAAPNVVKHLTVAGVSARHVPHMVLSAIRLVGEQLS